MLKNIAFSYYSVANMDRAIKFYETTLSLSPVFKGPNWSEFQINGHRIALYKNSKPIINRGGAIIYFLANPIEKTIGDLKSKGVQFIKELKIFHYGKLAEFLDSEGNILGLYEPPAKKK